MEVDTNPTFGSEMFAEYIDWRIEHPSDDLMTELLHTEFEDETGTTRTLTRDEALLYTTVVAGAGNETTTRLIGWAGKVLAEHPDQRRELVEDRALIPNAIEELLRYESPGPQDRALRAREGGDPRRDRARRERPALPRGAANRDDRRYDDPDRFDIHRKSASTSRSGTGSTSAWARRSRASKAASRSTSCSTGFPNGTSTSTARASRPPRRSAGSRRSR